MNKNEQYNSMWIQIQSSDWFAVVIGRLVTTTPPIDWIDIESYHNEINMFEQWRPIVLGQAQFR